MTAWLLPIVRSVATDPSHPGYRTAFFYWLGFVAPALIVPLFLHPLFSDRPPMDFTAVAGPALVVALVVSVRSGTFSSVIVLWVAAVIAIWTAIGAFAAFRQNARVTALRKTLTGILAVAAILCALGSSVMIAFFS